MMLESHIDVIQESLVRVLTPFYRGVGVYLGSHELILTTEKLVRNQRKVMVVGRSFGRRLVSVLYMDATHDVAILAAPGEGLMSAQLEWSDSSELIGQRVTAVSCLSDLTIVHAEGEVHTVGPVQDQDYYLEHSAWLAPRHSGSLLLDEHFRIIGLNRFISKDQRISKCLRMGGLKDVLDHLSIGPSPHLQMRCADCAQIISTEGSAVLRCPLCDSEIKTSIGQSIESRIGIPGLIEEIISDLGYEVRLAREGNHHWNVQRGSAFVNLSYHRDSGFIDGDAYLCRLPDNEQKVSELYDYLMRENYKTEGLVFSLKEDCILLSLRIYDRHLEKDTGRILIRNLFDKADYYDNVLIDRFQAIWIE